MAVLILWLAAAARAGGVTCPGDMAGVPAADPDFCVDRYEAVLDWVPPRGGAPRRWEYNQVPDAGGAYIAVSERGVRPQGYISRTQAGQACRNAQKRLCTLREWTAACRGSGDKNYPYANDGRGDARRPGVCNEHWNEPGYVTTFVRIFGKDPPYVHPYLADPRINALDGGLLPTGSKPECRSDVEAWDMVGNLHEWIETHAASGRALFKGGYYNDTEELGSGCRYMAGGHNDVYADYSTGFRCCWP